jgi:hypothetical protein
VAGYVSLILVAALPLGVALACQFAPQGNGPVAALFPPWWDAQRVFIAAGAAGPVMRFGALKFIVIVASNDQARLRAAGAWLLLDPIALGLCAPPIPGVT